MSVRESSGRFWRETPDLCYLPFGEWETASEISREAVEPDFGSPRAILYPDCGDADDRLYGTM